MEMKIEQELEAYAKENTFDLDNTIMLNEYPRRIMDKLSKRTKVCYRSMSLLELGLGHGYSAGVFEQHFDDYIVLEGDGRIIEKYKQENPETHIKIIETYFEEFDTERKFDVIVMGFILEHVEKPIEIMKKYAKYLKRGGGGRLFISVPNAGSLNRRIGQKAGLLEDLKQLSENDIKLGHRRYYDVDSFTEDINAADLEVVDLEGIYLKPFTTKQMLTLNLPEKIYDALCMIGRDYPELCLGILAEVKSRND